MLSLFIIFTLVAVSKCQLSEPRCSQFDYEEKTLHKMVRLEFSVEQTVNEVNQALSDMKEEVKKLQSEKDEMKREYMHYKVTHDTAMNSLKSIEKNISSLSMTPMVWFLAKDPVDITPATNQVIVYGTVLHNVGEPYDVTTGKFTAPYSGLYTFTIHACAHGKQSFPYLIRKDETILVKGRDYNHDGYVPCTSATVYTEMTFGESVWVAVWYGGSANMIYSAANYWNVFTGALVHK